MIQHSFGPPFGEGRERERIPPPPDLRVRKTERFSAPSIFSTVSPKMPYQIIGHLGRARRSLRAEYRLSRRRTAGNEKNGRLHKKSGVFPRRCRGPPYPIQISPKKSERYILCLTERAATHTNAKQQKLVRLFKNGTSFLVFISPGAVSDERDLFLYRLSFMLDHPLQ